MPTPGLPKPESNSDGLESTLPDVAADPFIKSKIPLSDDVSDDLLSKPAKILGKAAPKAPLILPGDSPNIEEV
ncbi:hypothetical protein D3C78_1644010 [compost metagenome]